MNDFLQSGTHIDADQLAAFAEGALPEHERLLVLAHTAECARCREIAFLAQEPAPAKAPAAERTPWWRAWSQPWVLGGAGALVASALVVGVLLWNRPGPVAPGEATTALSRMSAPPVRQEPDEKAERKTPMLDAAPPLAVRPMPMTSAPPRAAVPSRPLAVDQGAAGPQAALAAPATAMASAPPPAPAITAKAGVQAAAARAETQDKSMYSMAAPLPPHAGAAAVGAAPQALSANASPTTINNAQVPQLPMYARNLSTLRAAKARAGEAVNGPLHLQIEHGTGPNEGLAGLTGVVLDESGASIPGALIRLSPAGAGAGAQAVTDAAGHFSLPPVQAGKYQAQVTAPGFTSLTQPIDLLSRDVARADAVLAAGAASETVEVSADTTMVTNAAVSSSRVRAGGDALPSGLAAATMVSHGDRSVAQDSAGAVFARRTGKHWKQVKPRWGEKVVKLETAAGETDAKKTAASGFQITTAAGAVWVSADGEHWVRR